MVRCADCGFLARREHYTHELVEAKKAYREQGDFLPDANAKEAYDRLPLCFDNRLDFLDRLKARKTYSPPHAITPDELLALVSPEFACDGFVQWRQGFTPKEHREISDRQKVLEWQARREDADRVWREEQDRKRTASERVHLLMLAVVAGVFTIIGGVVGGLLQSDDTTVTVQHPIVMAPTPEP